VTWRNAFAPTPLCCPSRASFLTGEYTHNHGVMSHNDPWGYQLFDDSRTLATALQAAGYRTGYVGKYLNGFGADVPRAAPERTDSYTFVPNGWTDWRAAVDETPYPESDPRHGSTYDYFHLTLDVNGELVGHPGRYSSDVLADNAVDMLDGFTAAPDPWFLMVNSTAPHHGAPREPDDPGPVYAASGQLEPMVTPARPEWVKGKFDDVIRRGPGVRPDGTTEADVSDKMNQTRVRTELDDAERASVLEAARQRAEALFALDRALGRVFDRLRDSGELDRTILVFTSDNGYLLGEHRWREGKVVGYEPSYRIPMLMAGPGVPANENRYSPISMIDLTSTILDWADARLADTDGRSVVADVAADRGWTTPIGSRRCWPAYIGRRACLGSPTRVRRSASAPPATPTCVTSMARRSSSTWRVTRSSWSPSTDTRRTRRYSGSCGGSGPSSRAAVATTAAARCRPTCGRRRCAPSSCGS